MQPMDFWNQFPPGLPRVADGQSRVPVQPMDRASGGSGGIFIPVAKNPRSFTMKIHHDHSISQLDWD